MISELIYTVGQIFMTDWMLYMVFNVLWAKTGSCQNIFSTGAICGHFRNTKDSPKSYQKNSRHFIMNTSLLPAAPWRGFGFACTLATVLLEKHRSYLTPSFHLTFVLFLETFSQSTCLVASSCFQKCAEKWLELLQQDIFSWSTAWVLKLR